MLIRLLKFIKIKKITGKIILINYQKFIKSKKVVGKNKFKFWEIICWNKSKKPLK
jgi:hypothetical protein